MEAKYCVIGKPAGSDKYVTVVHEPMQIDDARRLVRLSPEYPTSIMLARFDKVEETINRLNAQKIDHENGLPRLRDGGDFRPNIDPQEYLESAISIAITACKREMLKLGKKVNVKEIYVGAESNEVQVTIEQTDIEE